MVNISHLKPQSYSPFYWWRRFQCRKTLPTNSSFLDKSRHGDYELSDYYVQLKYELELAEEKKSSLKNQLNDYKTREGAKEKINEIEKMKYIRYNRLMKDFVEDEEYLLGEFRHNIIKLFKKEFTQIKEYLEQTIPGYENIPNGKQGIIIAYEFILNKVVERSLKEDCSTTEDFFRLYCNTLTNFCKNI